VHGRCGSEGLYFVVVLHSQQTIVVTFMVVSYEAAAAKKRAANNWQWQRIAQYKLTLYCNAAAATRLK